MSDLNLPLVSIIIPCYNHEKYVLSAIDGIINQDYPNIELIIIDDGSKDGSIAMIKQKIDECRKRFIRFEFRHRPNKGLSATLNEALAWCQGKYVSFIASDDIMLSHKTSVQVDYLQKNPHISSLSANVQFIDDNGSILGSTHQPQKEYDFNEILVHNSLLAPTQIHHLSAVRDVGGFDENIMIEDWYLWLKLLDHGYRIMFLQDILASYRRHDNNMSGNLEKMFQAERQILTLYQGKPSYQRALYNLNRKELKIHRDNGNKLYYYLAKNRLILKYYLLGKV